MRQVLSSVSVRAFYLDREVILKRVQDIAAEALTVFPEIKEVRLFGSLARSDETGLSDIDIFLLAESVEKNPIERMRPYFCFFSDRFDIAIDMIVATPDKIENF